MKFEVFLSVIIPVYNEEKRISLTLSETVKYLRKKKYLFEIIVIDDGSTDNTLKEVLKLKKKIPEILVEKLEKNKGKGAAVRKGMMLAQGKYLLFMDADNSTKINEIEKFLLKIKEGYQIAIGSRDLKESILNPPQPTIRRILGKIFRLLAHLICGTWQIKDSQCGFKLFTKKAGKEIFPCSKIDGFAFDVEILVIAQKKGYKIIELPVWWENKSGSKVKGKKLLKMLPDLFKIRYYIWKGIYK